MSPVGVVIMKFAHTIARVSQRNENLGRKWATFGAGINAPFVASPPAVGSRAPTSLSRGGRSLHHGRGCHVVASSYCFTHGKGKTNKEHGQEKIVVQRKIGWKMLF
jgi:hypothetical protein